MRKPFLLLTFLCCAYCACAQTKTHKWLKELLYAGASKRLKQVLDSPGTYQYQLIYTQINRDKKNNPHLHHYFFNVDRNRYFNRLLQLKCRWHSWRCKSCMP